MKTMILTAKFGLGHVKAADAIREQILSRNPKADVVVIDFISYMFPNFEHVIYKSFSFLVSKCSGLYNLLNQLAGKNTTTPMKGAVIKRIERLVEKQNPEQIIVTVPVCTQYIAKYKQATGCQIPMYTVITDITAHDEWIVEGTDHYFVGDVTTKNTLLSKGVPAGSITVSGIPVMQKFNHSQLKAVGKQKKILIMGGGLGLIPAMDKILDGLSKREDVHVTVITGRNENLKKSLTQKYPKMEIIGFTNQVEVYMKRADLLVTKAGGITTFEAIASNTPLYVLKPFLEQEYGNAKYIEEHNIGKVLWESKMADEWEAFVDLIDHPAMLLEMQKCMLHLKAQYHQGGIGQCS